MPTYLLEEEYPITRKEGNTADIEILLPLEIELEGNQIILQVWNSKNNLVLEKNNEAWERIPHTANPEDPQDFDGTVIKCLLTREDTNNRPGNHFYEIYLTNSETNPHWTIAEGPFVILPKRSKTL